MCWCTPSIRTPFCGKPGCHPPVERAEPQADATMETVSRVITGVDERSNAWAKANGISYTAAQVAKQTDEGQRADAIHKLMLAAFDEGFCAGSAEAHADNRTPAEKNASHLTVRCKNCGMTLEDAALIVPLKDGNHVCPTPLMHGGII